MPTRPSAGVLLFRRTGAGLEVLLVLPGGPYWRSRDVGAWQIPKGAVEPGETPEAAALREFEEETGATLEGPLLPLGAIRQKGGKLVQGFALERDFDPAELKSIHFELEWPPRGGTLQSYPEVERAQWFTIAEARGKMLESQQPLLDRLLEMLDG